jgi:hypothetical protein
MESGPRFGAALTEYTKAAFGAGTEAIKSFGTTTGVNYMLPIIGGLVAVTLVAIIVFVIIQAKETKPAKLLKGPVDLFQPDSPVVIDRPTTATQMKGSYTLAFYVRIDAVPDMRTADTPLLTWPGIWDVGYNAATEQLVWKFAQTADAPNTWAFTDPVTVDGVPMQRWTQIVITFEGRTADLYVNGGLVTSNTLRNLPPSAVSSITIVPAGVMGQLAYGQLWSRRLTVSEIAANYTDTSDSQGRPFLGPDLLGPLKNLKVPNLFCPSGNCSSSSPTASQSQTWEFPYA